MPRLFKSLLAVLLLVGQFHLVAHAYEEHTDEQPCDVCITLKQQEQATESSPPSLFIQSSYQLVANKNLVARSNQHLTYFSVRAPPSYL